MMKMVLIVILMIITSMLGNNASEKLKKRAAYLKLILLMLSEIEVLIKYKSATVFEILSELSKKSCFSDLQFLKHAEIIHKNTDKSFEEIWTEAVSAEKIKADDLTLIMSLGRRLGKCELDGQISALSLLKSETEAMITEAEKIYAEKGKLYRCLGVLTGAFISILII